MLFYFNNKKGDEIMQRLTHCNIFSHKRLIAQTSLEFDNNLQPFLINGADILPLSDEYIKMAKQILAYIPILPTSERIYDIALYLTSYDLQNIKNDIDTYINLVKQRLINQKLLNDKAQITKR